MLISKALWRFFLTTPWSSAMTLIGITLGVASIVSVHLISRTVADQLDTLVDAELSGYSYFLHREELMSSDYFELRRQWRRGQYEGVESIAPFVDERILIDNVLVRVLGVDLLQQTPGRTQVRDTTIATVLDGVWVDESLKLKFSDRLIEVIDAPKGTLIGDIGVAQEILGWQKDRLSYVGIKYDDPTQPLRDFAERVLPGASAGMPLTGLPQIDGWRVKTLADQNPANQFGKSVLFNVSALGMLALMVAWFLIYQVAVAWLRRLWPVFQRLHVLGVEHKTLRYRFLSMMVVFGIVSGLGGLYVGQLLAVQLYSAALPLSAAAIVLSIDIWVVAKSLGSSVSVCLIGGWWAFVQNQRAGEPRRRLRYYLAAMGLVVIIVGIAVDGSGLLGAFISIAVLSLFAVSAVSPVLHLLRRRAHRIAGPALVRLGLREVIWYPRDLSIALAGLSLAIATAIGVGLMVDSFRGDFDRMLDRRLSYDWSVVGEAPDLGRFLLVAQQATGMRRLQTYYKTQLRLQGMPVEVNFTQLDAYEAQRYGMNRAVGSGEVLIGEQVARLLNLQVGDNVRFAQLNYAVVGVFTSFGDLLPRVVVHRSADGVGAITGGALNVDKRVGLQHVASSLSSIGMNTDTSVDISSWVASMEGQFPSLEFRSQRGLRHTALETFDRTFAITSILIAIAIMVAGIGVYIAITALRLNQTVSTKLLMTMGVSRWENLGIDLARGLGIGVCAMLLALPLGLGLGWILCHVVNPRAFGWTVTMQVAAWPVLSPVLWGLLAAVLGGLVRVGRSEEGVVGG